MGNNQFKYVSYGFSASCALFSLCGKLYSLNMTDLYFASSFSKSGRSILTKPLAIQFKSPNLLASPFFRILSVTNPFSTCSTSHGPNVLCVTVAPEVTAFPKYERAHQEEQFRPRFCAVWLPVPVPLSFVPDRVCDLQM